MIKQNNRGFTIIEVVLVLAIAGLIFLMVFIAVPAMNRNSRDTARKNDASLVSQAVTNYTGANRGSWPDDSRLQEYVGELSGNSAVDKIRIMEKDNDRITGLDQSDQEGAIVVVHGADCGESTRTEQILADATSRQFVVVNLLEAGGGQYYCVKGG
ncbi:type II secretion system protein [Candidatus Saccharibacteria bacterium]|nr:type II secretion system protein [Candidatus Saccharibacteria bacterium]